MLSFLLCFFLSISSGDDVKVVALGTGSKCIGQNKMSKEGKGNLGYSVMHPRLYKQTHCAGVQIGAVVSGCMLLLFCKLIFYLWATY